MELLKTRPGFRINATQFRNQCSCRNRAGRSKNIFPQFPTATQLEKTKPRVRKTLSQISKPMEMLKQKPGIPICFYLPKPMEAHRSWKNLGKKIETSEERQASRNILPNIEANEHIPLFRKTSHPVPEPIKASHAMLVVEHHRCQPRHDNQHRHLSQDRRILARRGWFFRVTAPARRESRRAVENSLSPAVRIDSHRVRRVSARSRGGFFRAPPPVQRECRRAVDNSLFPAAHSDIATCFRGLRWRLWLL